MKKRNITLLLLVVPIILVPLISGSAFATATAMSYVSIKNFLIQSHPEWNYHHPDEAVNGFAIDSLGNGDGYGTGDFGIAQTPYAYQAGKVWGLQPGGGVNIWMTSIANATSHNMWAFANGDGSFLVDFLGLTEPDFLISFDFEALLYGFVDSYGYFSAFVKMSLGPLWSFSDAISGTKGTVLISYSEHVDIYTLGTSSIVPYVSTYAYATNIPEPATMLLLGSGLIGLAGYGRKKFFKK